MNAAEGYACQHLFGWGFAWLALGKAAIDESKRFVEIEVPIETHWTLALHHSFNTRTADPRCEPRCTTQRTQIKAEVPHPLYRDDIEAGCVDRRPLRHRYCC